MIYSRSELNEYLMLDAKASARESIYPKIYGDEIWKFQRVLRKLEYYEVKRKNKKKWAYIPYAILKLKFHRKSLQLGFSIPVNVFDKGLSIPHYGTIVVSKNAKVGENCRIHETVTIGATNGMSEAAQIGKNVFIGTGAKIIGAVEIADDVAIAANAVVINSIFEKGTTWGGNPARKISSNNSHLNLNIIV